MSDHNEEHSITIGELHNSKSFVIKNLSLMIAGSLISYAMNEHLNPNPLNLEHWYMIPTSLLPSFVFSWKVQTFINNVLRDIPLTGTEGKKVLESYKKLCYLQSVSHALAVGWFVSIVK